MITYTVTRRINGRYPYCIDRIDEGGSQVVVERWQSEALATDRMGDIRDETARLERQLKREAVASS